MRIILVILASVFAISSVSAQWPNPYLVRPRTVLPYNYQYHNYWYTNPGPYSADWEARVRRRWSVQDDYRERNKTENALDRKERMFDQAERSYSLKQREYQLRKEGVLPPKDPNSGSFVVDGVRFFSQEEYRRSPQYQDMLYRQEQKRKQEVFEKDQKQIEEDRYFAFLRMYRKMGPSARQRYSLLSPEEKEMRIDEQMIPGLQQRRLQADADMRFYEKYPWLIPGLGKTEPVIEQLSAPRN